MHTDERQSVAGNPPQEFKDRPWAAPAVRQAVGRSADIILQLDRALAALVKAQDHLNKAADQNGGESGQVMAGIIENLKGLQREVSNAMHTIKHEALLHSQ
jgi:GTP1/Obg family GTP-binding protein